MVHISNISDFEGIEQFCRSQSNQLIPDECKKFLSKKNDYL